MCVCVIDCTCIHECGVSYYVCSWACFRHQGNIKDVSNVTDTTTYSHTGGPAFEVHQFYGQVSFAGEASKLCNEST